MLPCDILSYMLYIILIQNNLEYQKLKNVNILRVAFAWKFEKKVFMYRLECGNRMFGTYSGFGTEITTGNYKN